MSWTRSINNKIIFCSSTETRVLNRIWQIRKQPALLLYSFQCCLAYLPFLPCIWCKPIRFKMCLLKDYLCWLPPSFLSQPVYKCSVHCIVYFLQWIRIRDSTRWGSIIKLVWLFDVIDKTQFLLYPCNPRLALHILVSRLVMVISPLSLLSVSPILCSLSKPPATLILSPNIKFSVSFSRTLPAVIRLLFFHI